jgi:uncharacterized protein YabE (DUF348 family)
MSKKKRLSRRYVSLRRAAKKQSTFHFHGLKNHPLVVPVLAFLALFFLSSVGLVLVNSQTVTPSDLHSVSVAVDGETKTIPTRAKTVQDLLDRLNIEVNEQDIIEPSLDTKILEDNFTVKVLRARPVTIVDSGKRITVLSAHQQPRTVVEKAGIVMYPEDGIKQAEASGLGGQPIIGENIEVDRAQAASINLYGNSIAVRTRAKTVGELLAQKNIKPIEGDTVEPARDTPLSNNMQIFVVREGKKVITVEEVIPAPVTTIDDPNLAAGATVVKEAGTDGKKLVTYEVELRNNQEVGRKVLQEVTAVNPIKRVVSKGTKVLITGGRAEWLVAAGVSPDEYYAVDYIVGKESGWCPTKWQGEYGGCPAFHGTPSGGIGYGLCQATPGSKMSTAGADWAVNPVTQLKWCTNYARTRYGSWTAAYNFWVVNRWW